MQNSLSSLVLLLLGLANLNSQSIQVDSLVKYEPEDGACLVFIGQDLGATGGLDAYNDGYFDHFDMEAGITTYTNISPGDESFGYFNRGNDGIKKSVSWGAGDVCAQCYVDDPDFKYSMISIGLSIVNHEKKIAKGKHDALIRDLGNWIKSISPRPVFLRIGYEFDGWSWNHYSKKSYLKSWQRIRTIFDDMDIENVAYVWQSKGWGSGQETLEDWYPGDELVDWCAYSYFGNPDTEMLTFARKHNKPVFIAEATPVLQTENLFFNTRLSDTTVAKRAWQQWFIPFFQTLEENSDVIKAFSYINVNWSAQAMWIINPTFQQVDSRIQVSKYISERWRAELKKERYVIVSW